MKPEKAKVIIVPKEQIEERKAEGYKLIREIDGKSMMES
jgi:predicted nucleic acid-binding protein